MKKKIFENWRSFLEELVDPDTIDLSSFKIKDTLCPAVWDGNIIKEDILKKLVKIAMDFFIELGFDESQIKDIVLTGSLANYMWSEYSDIDLHLLVNFSEFSDDTKMVKEMFDGKRFIWNQNHDIKIVGHEVEIYVQDESEPHVSSGIYSLLNNKWIIEPNRNKPEVKWDEVQEKAACFMNEIDEVEQLFSDGETEEALKGAERLKKRVKGFRKCGLEKGGEFSSENLAFKVMRRNGYLEKLANLKDNSYDKAMSIHENWRSFLEEEAKGPNDLPKGWGIVIKDGNNSFEVHLLNKDKNIVPGTGHGKDTVIKLQKPEPTVTDCVNAYQVTWVNAPKGWGPLLYDVAMEFAVFKGAEGIFADRTGVSPAAQKIWNYYAHKREGEIEKFHPLDEEEDEECRVIIKDYFGDSDWEPTDLIYRRRDGATPTIDMLGSMGKIKIK